MFQSRDIESGIQKLILYLHFTKPLKRDNIYKNVFMDHRLLEEHICLVLTPKPVLRLGYKACDSKYEPLLPCAESPKHDKIKTICL